MNSTLNRMTILRMITGISLVASTAMLSGCEKDYFYIAPPPTAPVSLSMDLQPIFDASCTGCHDGSLAPDLTAGNAHASLWSTGDIDTANPANSILYQRVILSPSAPGAMPPGGPSLTSTETALILKWIEDGASNN